MTPAELETFAEDVGDTVDWHHADGSVELGVPALVDELSRDRLGQAPGEIGQRGPPGLLIRVSRATLSAEVIPSADRIRWSGRLYTVQSQWARDAASLTYHATQ